MKKILLSLILIAYTNHLLAEQSPTHLALTQEESEILDYLNDSYIQDKLFYKNFSHDDLALSLDILSKEIQLLNKEMLPKNIRRVKSFLIALGVIPLSIAICFTAPFSQVLYKLYTQFKSGKFKDITLPLYIIEKLPSKTISREEKRYLKRFSFEKQYFEYVIDPFASKLVIDPTTGRPRYISQEEVIQNKIANLSPAEQEKIKYLALRSAITDLKLQALGHGCLIFIVLIVGAFYSSPFFYGAFMYEVEIQEKIKTYKKLYNLLKKEQERYQST